MTKLYLDFETYCDLDLKQVGLYKYLAHSSFHPWCAAYAIDDEPVYTWKKDQYTNWPPLEEAFKNPKVKIVAFNAEFELGVINQIWPSYNMGASKFIDVQALAGMFGYPINLKGFCNAIGSPPKSGEGTRLINKLCKLQKKTAFNPEGKWTPETAPGEFKKLYSYCQTDVEVMRTAYKRLPMEDLPPMESLVWRHTILQNQRGLEVDLQTVKHIKIMLQLYQEKLTKELVKLTEGEIQTGKQVAKIREFLATKGLILPNLSAEMVTKQLARKGLPPVAVRVLQLRQLLAYSSGAKFTKILAMALKGRVQGNLKYHKAHTGRFAGQGFQIHNLPRATLDDPEMAIALFNKCDIDKIITTYPDVNYTASALIRPCIIAKKGFKLLVADYKSIENVLLHWCANDQKTLQDFRNGVDQYTMYASKRFGIPYEEVTPKERTYAKPCVLGLGYGGGKGALIKVAKDYGITLNPAEAQTDVDFYRKKQYPLVPKLWYSIFKRAKLAVKTGEPQIYYTGTTKIEFRAAGGYLFILLPSGRRLSYPNVSTDNQWYITVKGHQVPMAADISYMGVRNEAWLRLGLHPGLLIENIIQALARDFLVYGMLCVEQAGFSVLASVHDEIICEVYDNSQWALDTMIAFACTQQTWSKDIPIFAEGYEARRYRKE